MVGTGHRSFSCSTVTQHGVGILRRVWRREGEWCSHSSRGQSPSVVDSTGSPAPFSDLKIFSAFLRGEQRCGAAREPPIPLRSSHVDSSEKRFAGICYTPFFFFFFRCLCLVYVYVYMCMCIHVCTMCMHTHVETRGQPQRSFQGLCSLFSETGSLIGLWSHWLDKFDQLVIELQESSISASPALGI